MSTEIEAKFKVDSLEKIRERLEELGAEFVAEQSQEDILFDNADGTLAKADSCIRLRKLTTDNNTKFILTYKGAKEKSDFKKRRELETEISNVESVRDIFHALGYNKKITVEKKRSVWKYGGCEVALDRLKLLGDFVEIEGPNENAINDVQESLGLADLKHIPDSYASLIADKMKEMKKQG